MPILLDASMQEEKYKNNLPKPVKYFLQADSYRAEDVLYHKTSFFPFIKNRDVQEVAKRALLDRVMPYYEKRGLQVNTAPYNFLVEPLKNANFHGGRDGSGNGEISFELFLTPLVLAASYRDGGRYFMRQEVKKAWESKIVFPEIHELHSEEVGFGFGIGLIYGMADFIHVDTSSGTLYTGMMTKKFCG